jgi:hypothetical protein
VGPVFAVITPTSTALTIAQAIASSSVTVTGASFAAVPPSGTPNGVSTSVLGGFPVDGASYGILTSGDVSSVDQPGTFADTGNGGPNVRGDSDEDVSILKIDLTVPQGANCLSFNFKFLSEEFPTYVGSSFNDAFIAELDTSDWTTSGSAITAPHNFAFDAALEVVSINSTGIGGMTPANGAGTAFDGAGENTDGAATVLLGAATPVTSGAHSLYLSLFDQGDDSLDSAVFLDNLRIGSVPNPATDCKAGATQPALLTLVKSVTNTGGGTQAPAAWTLSATGPTTIEGATGSAAVTSAAVSPGTYTLGETGPTGYSAGAWSCQGGSLTGASLVLTANQTATCSITNTFVPIVPNAAQLTLVKSVVNTGSGTQVPSAWTLTATGPTTIQGATGSAAVTSAAVSPGTYTLSESGPAGYAASAWSCVGGSLQGSSLTLTAEQSATCTITNTYTGIQAPPVEPITGSLVVTTTVAGNPAGFPGGSFGYTATCGTATYQLIVTVAPGQTGGTSNSITGLMPTSSCTVAQTGRPDPGTDASWSGAPAAQTVGIISGQTAAAAMVNVRTMPAGAVEAVTATPKVTLPPTSTVGPSDRAPGPGGPLPFVLVLLAAGSLGLALTTPLRRRTAR